ncbi:MAG TPA: phosphoribosyl-AMP cyclohydrolase [Candidatus Methylacidiphilales bacterium]|nr:phosphoribosyl-AMP cyclohydrolase [Candidatus Methylacidiphilales bacterium]
MALSVYQIEEGNKLAPRFDLHEYLPCITMDATSGEVLMLGFMTPEALDKTIATGKATYYSRSRKKIWVKGEESGLVQTVKELMIDDDQDCVLIKVDVAGGASCHVGYRSCFYRKVKEGVAWSLVAGTQAGGSDLDNLDFTIAEKTFDPLKTYGAHAAPSPELFKLEEGAKLMPRFDLNPYLPCITMDADSGEVLMLGYMTPEALEKTIATKKATYYSRSRKKLWIKGEESGLTQHVQEVMIDDDQDCILIRVKVTGGASCHVGYRSCFYRKVKPGTTDDLEFTIAEKTFDPVKVYGPHAATH